ncbi:MAG: hypothetical protein ACPGWS_07345, partial [Solirubrobacterales bacterium]
MGSPKEIQHIRHLIGTTLRTDFSGLVYASMARLRVTDLTKSLNHGSVPAMDMRGNRTGQNANIPTTRLGEVAFKTYLAARTSGSTNTPRELTTLSGVLGGVQDISAQPAATDTAEAASDTTTLALTGHGVSAGGAIPVLVGARGDAAGEGEVRLALYNDANTLDLNIALQDEPDDDTIVYGSAAYFDETAAQQYFDFWGVGHGTYDQWQAIGCMGSVVLEGGGPGEVPMLAYNFKAH